MYKGRSDIKLKTFYSSEEYCTNPSGSRYVTKHYAEDAAAKFINKQNIYVIDIKYTRDSVCVIYIDKNSRKAQCAIKNKRNGRKEI